MTSCGWPVQPLASFFSVEPTCLHPDGEVNMEETMHMILMTSSAWSIQPLYSAVLSVESVELSGQKNRK